MTLWMICLYSSLRAKLRACVGKQQMVLARVPLQDSTLCSLGMHTTRSMMVLYYLLTVICLLVFCTCSSSLTHLIGATAVLEVAVVMPLVKKSLWKGMACSVMGGRADGAMGR